MRQVRQRRVTVGIDRGDLRGVASLGQVSGDGPRHQQTVGDYPAELPLAAIHRDAEAVGRLPIRADRDPDAPFGNPPPCATPRCRAGQRLDHAEGIFGATEASLTKRGGRARPPSWA
jgi:hypothetical protein